jgi:hypothetical protein
MDNGWCGWFDVDEALPAGDVERTWGGRDSRGRALPSGYLARVATADGAASRKLLLVK